MSGTSLWEKECGTHIDANQVDLSVTVLARLGGGHVDDLAGTACKIKKLISGGRGTRGERHALHDDVAVLAKGRALHGEGGGSPGIGLGRGMNCMSMGSGGDLGER